MCSKVVRETTDRASITRAVKVEFTPKEQNKVEKLKNVEWSIPLVKRFCVQTRFRFGIAGGTVLFYLKQCIQAGKCPYQAVEY